jgi:tetratricopeptide (TPR) repeat protein
MHLDKETILQEFNEIETKDPVRARSLIKKLDFKSDHNLLKNIAMTYLDEAQFDENDEWRYYADNRKLRMAERYILKAFEIKPTCSNVLWILGKVRTAYGQNDAAIYCYQDIIRLGAKRISNSCCKNDLDVALAQINDSKFELYRLFKDVDSSKSKRYLTQYKKALEKGIWTLFDPLDKFL